MRSWAALVLRGLVALTVAVAALVTAVTASAAALVAIGAQSLADGYPLAYVGVTWVLTTGLLLSISRLAYLGARALAAKPVTTRD
jgi:hypothetical protein